MLSGQRGRFGQDTDMIKVENSGRGCTMGVSFRGDGVNSFYALFNKLVLVLVLFGLGTLF